MSRRLAGQCNATRSPQACAAFLRQRVGNQSPEGGFRCSPSSLHSMLHAFRAPSITNPIHFQRQPLSSSRATGANGATPRTLPPSLTARQTSRRAPVCGAGDAQQRRRSLRPNLSGSSQACFLVATASRITRRSKRTRATALARSAYLCVSSVHGVGLFGCVLPRNVRTPALGYAGHVAVAHRLWLRRIPHTPMPWRFGP